MDYGNKNIIIHIGMPKCASTTLQRNFFERLPMINYGGNGDNSELSKLVKGITLSDGLYFDKRVVKKKLTEYIDKEKPLVISSEHGSGMILPLTRNIPQCRKVIAKRYKSLFPDAKILVIIRNQFNIQKSVYVQTLVSNNKFVSIKRSSFKRWIELNIYQKNKGWMNCFEFADYYPLIKFYKDNFKEVKVVIFEEMIKDMSGFIQNELSSFIGISGEEAIQYFNDIILNSRHTKGELFFERINRNIINFLQKNLGNPQKAIPEKTRKEFMKKFHHAIDSISIGHIKTNYSKEQLQFMKDFYGENNRKLSKLIDVDLQIYGYPL